MAVVQPTFEIPADYMAKLNSMYSLSGAIRDIKTGQLVKFLDPVENQVSNDQTKEGLKAVSATLTKGIGEGKKKINTILKSTKDAISNIDMDKTAKDIAQFAKDNKEIIIVVTVGAAVVTTIAFVSKHVSKKRKNSGAINNNDGPDNNDVDAESLSLAEAEAEAKEAQKIIMEYQDARTAYIMAVTDKTMTEQIINRFIQSISQMQEGMAASIIKIELSTESTNTTFNIVDKYTEELARANGLTKEQVLPKLQTAEKSEIINLASNLQAQQKIFEMCS